MNPSLPPGHVVGNRYVVERALGNEAGGRRAVLATAPDGAKVVVKTLGRRARSDAEAAARLRRETGVAERVRGPRTARVLESGVDPDGTPFLVLAWIEGESLAKRLERGPLPVRLAVDVATELCEALAPAHAAGIAHRDVRPENVVLRGGADDRVDACLVGFSFATASSAESLGITATGALIGLPDYAAPEQIATAMAAGPPADVWSVGVVLFEMLSGTTPFDADSVPRTCRRVLEDPAPSLREAGVDVPAELDLLVRECLAKDPSRRPPDVATLAEKLARFGGEAAAQASVMARRTLPRPSSSVAFARGRGPAIALGLGLAVLAAIAAYFFATARR